MFLGLMTIRKRLQNLALLEVVAIVNQPWHRAHDSAMQPVAYIKNISPNCCPAEDQLLF